MVEKTKSIAPPAAALPDEDAPEDSPEAWQTAEQRLLTVPAALHGERLDRALAALTPGFSRSYLSQLIAEGAVQIAGSAALKPARRVKAGEALAIEAAVAQVVAVNGGDNNVTQVHGFDGFCEVFRFVRVEHIRAAVSYVAEPLHHKSIFEPVQPLIRSIYPHYFLLSQWDI